MPLNPIAHGPAVGYAMWQLARGESAPDVRRMLATHQSGRNLSEEQLYEAVYQGQLNLEQTRRIQLSAENVPLASGYYGSLFDTQKMGVRVKLWLRYPDGRAQEVSVTINAPGTATRGEVLEVARQFYRSGAYRSHWQAGYEGEIMTDAEGREQTDEGESTVEIIALVAGGLPSPAVGPPMLE